MPETFAELVYDTLCGDIQGEYAVPGVENAFADGGECDRLYNEMSEACQRLQHRLGFVEEDEDVDTVIRTLEQVQRILAIKMFHYGQKFH